MSRSAIGDVLAETWLSQISPNWPGLVDIGERYQGCPVYTVVFNNGAYKIQVKVYKYCPVGSQHPRLAFLP